MDFTQTIDEPSTSENVTVPRAGREYLLEHEVERLIEVAKGNRQGHRVNAAIVSGSDVTTPSRSIFPVRSTMQIAVSFSDTSSPT